MIAPRIGSCLSIWIACNDTPSGPMVKKLCERAHRGVGDRQYKRLAGISVSHLFNLRKGEGYCLTIIRMAGVLPHQERLPAAP